jgi:hypothetical protein
MKKILLLPHMIFAFCIPVKCTKFPKRKCILKSRFLGRGASGVFFGGFSLAVIFSADIGVHNYVSLGPYIGATFFRFA